MRVQARNVIVDALTSSTVTPDSSFNAVDIGMAIETELYVQHKPRPIEYRRHARMLAINLKRNTDLRNKVILQAISNKELCQMREEEMATKEVRNDRAKAQVDAFPIPTAGAMADGIFKCRKCGSLKTVSTQAQTRRADEGMTVFVTCFSCNNHWKL